jgi:uncharacterized protein (DUF433 family)
MSGAKSEMAVDPEILSGTPVFAGTRVPVHTLMDYLKAGDRVDDFIEDFPTVTRAQVEAVLDVANEAVDRYARSA